MIETLEQVINTLQAQSKLFSDAANVLQSNNGHKSPRQPFVTFIQAKRHMSDETKKKMSVSQTARHARARAAIVKKAA